jgi:predicted enzyme related to lactoylglutathione lyase
MSTQKTTYAPGTFCWPELSSTDQAGAEKFYSALFGWTLKQTPMGPDSHYTIFEKNGETVAALAQMDKQMKGVPSYWLSYVSTANVDASVDKAKTLGATVVAGPFDVMERPHGGVDRPDRRDVRALAGEPDPGDHGLRRGQLACLDRAHDRRHGQGREVLHGPVRLGHREVPRRQGSTRCGSGAARTPAA